MTGHPLWAEIDLAAIAHNVRELRRITRPSTRLLVAVKANGYGHGAEQVARTALRHGATDLGVARISEGIALRRGGISAPILIFGYTPAACVNDLLVHQLVPTVSCLQNARDLNAAAAQGGRRLPVHIKIDTGMGRLGFACDGLHGQEPGQAQQAIREMARMPHLTLEGIFTHFAGADQADLRHAARQFELFTRLTATLAADEIHFTLRHAANSGAILQMPETHLDMVRAGIAVYGLYPSSEVDRVNIALKPALALKANIVHLKQVPGETCISYGCTYRTSRPTTIATVPVGYADGYRRGLSNIGYMLVAGRPARIVGRVCMDLTMIDVGLDSQARVGDEVVLIGRQQGAVISAEEMAATLGTIHYEVVAALTERVPRVFLNETA
jgi:alanine racemase